MAVEFKIVKHESRDVEIVEVWINGQMRAAIYPNGDGTGIRLLSRHIEDVALDPVGEVTDVRAFNFTFQKERVQ